MFQFPASANNLFVFFVFDARDANRGVFSRGSATEISDMAYRYRAQLTDPHVTGSIRG